MKLTTKTYEKRCKNRVKCLCASCVQAMPERAVLREANKREIKRALRVMEEQ